MSLPNTLATAFDDEVVILDSVRGSLLLLDPWAAQVWRSCHGATTDAIVSSLHGTVERVRETLQALTDAGLIRLIGDTWSCGPVEWV